MDWLSASGTHSIEDMSETRGDFKHMKQAQWTSQSDSCAANFEKLNSKPIIKGTRVNG